jgi:L-fuculose-phosphate aldolase
MRHLQDKPLPDQIVYICRLMFKRKLTDIAGGNVSARLGDQLFITPKYAGSKWHWHLEPQDIITGPINSDELVENPSFSREGLSHISVYRAFPEVKAIIHAHPRDVLPFCSLEMPIQPVLRATQEYEVLEFIDQTPEYSQEQADNIVDHLKGKEELMNDTAAAVLMPQHGIFIAGKDLWEAVDNLERINTNAWCLIARKILLDD